jgi:hypothetical protein
MVNYLAYYWAISNTAQENPRKIPGKSQENPRKIPGKSQENPRNTKNNPRIPLEKPQ